ncbi:MAG: SCP2 sterol-binding domain-containing protein [Actinomycetota bacterium]|nr:SCP2 sterol-binding domain-containing protein [Actinomycetota bacterium]
MAVKFLSEDWAEAVTKALDSHEGFQGSIRGMELTLQFIVTDVPERDDIWYFVQIADGQAVVQRGTLQDPDLTVTNSYQTAAAISQGELNTQTAFITGKLKVQGNMAKLMMHQAALEQFANAVAHIDVEY